MCQLQFDEQEEPQEIGALQDRAEAERDSEAVSKLNFPPVSFDSIRCGPLLATVDVNNRSSMTSITPSKPRILLADVYRRSGPRK